MWPQLDSVQTSFSEVNSSWQTAQTSTSFSRSFDINCAYASFLGEVDVDAIGRCFLFSSVGILDSWAFRLLLLLRVSITVFLSF